MKKKFESMLGSYLIATLLFISVAGLAHAEDRADRREKEWREFQERLEWWPTDAAPGPVKDEERGGYWWWPTTPGKIGPLWGNRGYVYVKKIIFDYKEEELPPPKAGELRPSLLIKKMIKNVKIYFDYDRADLRDDAVKILKEAVGTLKRNREATILVTGNCDMRGPEAYNEKLGRRRAEAVKKFMLDSSIADERIRIISRGKLDAIAPITDLVGMQKDRNAQFMIAEVKEVMLPYPTDVELSKAEPLGGEKYLIEKKEEVESQIRVSTRPYVVKEGETLPQIAEEQLGSSHRWEFLYEYNRGVIADPKKLTAGTVISIPIEQEDQQRVPPVQKEIPPVSKPATREYIIKKNDSLWKIAQQELGSGMRWIEINELNKDKIKDPNKLVPGLKIILPLK